MTEYRFSKVSGEIYRPDGTPIERKHQSLGGLSDAICDELNLWKQRTEALEKQLTEAQEFIATTPASALFTLARKWIEAAEADRDALRSLLESVMGLLNEMHPHVGCASEPCTRRTDFCVTREAVYAAVHQVKA